MQGRECDPAEGQMRDGVPGGSRCPAVTADLPSMAEGGPVTSVREPLVTRETRAPGRPRTLAEAGSVGS